MSPNWTKQVQMYPNSPRLRNRYAIICKNLENQLYSWDLLSLELNFSLLWKPMIACLPKHPHLGSKLPTSLPRPRQAFAPRRSLCLHRVIIVYDWS